MTIQACFDRSSPPRSPSRTLLYQCQRLSISSQGCPRQPASVCCHQQKAVRVLQQTVRLPTSMWRNTGCTSHSGIYRTYRYPATRYDVNRCHLLLHKVTKYVMIRRLHSQWQGSPSAASICRRSAKVASNPNPDVFPPQQMSRPYRLNFSLLTHEPIHAPVWALMDAEGLLWEVTFAVQVGKYFGQSCVEDFGCNRRIPRPHGQTKRVGTTAIKIHT